MIKDLPEVSVLIWRNINRVGFCFSILTQCGLVMPCGVIEFCLHWFTYWLSAKWAPSHYLNQWCQLDPREQILVKFKQRYTNILSQKCIWKYLIAKCQPFCSGLIVLTFKYSKVKMIIWSKILPFVCLISYSNFIPRDIFTFVLVYRSFCYIIVFKMLYLMMKMLKHCS